MDQEATAPPSVQSQPAKSSVTSRIRGIITFNSAIYREIAHDSSATMQAFLVQTITVLSLSLLILGVILITEPSEINIGLIWLIIIIPIIILINVIIVIIQSSVLAFVARIFKGTAKTETIYRVMAYTQIFVGGGVISFIGTIIGFILQLIGITIGLREAAHISTGKAILTVLLVFIGFTILLISIIVALTFFTETSTRPDDIFVPVPQ